jgi:hypothetical protein
VIIYLATYPRSGNSLLQAILRKSYGVPRSDRKVGGFQGLGAATSDPPSIELRRHLAGDPEQAYLKIHGRPFAPFIDGEQIVQFVRNPGAALWSYFRLVADQHPQADIHAFRGRPPTLDAVISGEIGAGTGRSIMTRGRLPERHLRIDTFCSDMRM